MKKNYNNISENAIKNEIVDALKKDKRNLVEKDRLIISKVINLLIEDDKELFAELISNKTIRDNFSIDINGSLIFDKQKLIDLIKTNNEFINDSFTKYANKIGLKTTNNEFIIDNDDVVLNFPYKDCVLEFDSTDPNVERDEIFYNEILAKEKITKLYSNKVFSNVKKISAIEIEKENREKKKIKQNELKEFKIKEEKCAKFDINDNLLIKGNNLLAMHSLLSRYENKIKLMYWDILYNTKKTKENKGDIVPYNDSFKHSSWLVMMKNRLEVAKMLLSDDGVICLQCDDNEMHYLKVLCDEIFGRENFLNCLVVESGGTLFGNKVAHVETTFVKQKDYILVYSKRPNSIEINPLYDSIEPFDTHFNKIIISENETYTLNSYLKKQDSIMKMFKQYNIEFKDENINIMMKIDDRFEKYINEEIAEILFQDCPYTNDISKENMKKLKDNNIVLIDGTYVHMTSGGKLRFYKSFKDSIKYADDYNSTFGRCGTRGDLWKGFGDDMKNVEDEGGVELKNGKKPERLLSNILKAFTKKNDIVFDAYFGTGTTGAVAMKMERRFIGIEQLDEHFKKAKTRLTNVVNGDKTGISNQVKWYGGGSFVCVEMAQNNENFKSKINKAKTDKELEKIRKEMTETAYISVDIDVSKVIDTEKDFAELSLKDKKKVLLALLDNNHLYVNIEDIDDKEFKIDESYKLWTKSFYNM